VEVKGYAVMSGPEGSEGVALPYPEPDGETVRGVSFHHGRFVMQLRRAAARAPKYTPLVFVLFLRLRLRFPLRSFRHD
jgi:hypothetical protein